MDDSAVSILTNRSALENFTTVHSNKTSNYLDFLEPTLHLGVAKILCSLPGLLINIIFVITVCSQTKLWKSLKLLTLLAVGDFLLAAFVLAIGITDVLTSEKSFQLQPYECFYKRPHFIFYLWGVHVQSMATLFVALERGIAVWFPYHYIRYNKNKFINSAIGLCILTTSVSFVASLIISIKRGTTTPVYHALCYPSLTVNIYYSGFLFALIIALGTMAITIYVFIFGFEMYEKCLGGRNELSESGIRFEANQRQRRMWLLKISAILAFTAFLCIVIPNTVLYIGRDDRSHKSIVGILRMYISFFMAANSFFGIALCVVASPELRLSLKATFLCRKYQPESSSTAASVRTRMSRLSSSAVKVAKVADEQF